MHRILGLLIALALVAAACDSGDSDGSSAADGPSRSGDAPAECDRQPPYTIGAEGLNEPAAGSSEFEVADAVAQRIPVVPNPEGGILEDEAKVEADDEAASTDLAIYAIHAADFPLERDDFDGFGFARPDVPPDGAVAVVSVLPPTVDGLAAGDVVRHGEPEFEATTTFATVGAYVQTAEREPADNAFTDMSGGVTILALDDDSICVDVDISVSDGADPVATFGGVIVADVVRVDDSFYLT